MEFTNFQYKCNISKDITIFIAVLNTNKITFKQNMFVIYVLIN